MKALIAILCTLLLYGCYQKPVSDPRISKLEISAVELTGRMEKAEQVNAEQNKLVRELIDLIKANNATNNELMTSMGLTLALHVGDQSIHRTNITVLARPATAGTKPVPVTGGMTRGIPNQIYQGIYSAAEKKWTGNYEMQEYEIKNQIEAYRKLHP